MNRLLLPLVAVEGRWVRARAERLPPAAGPDTGTVEPPNTVDLPSNGSGAPGLPLTLAVLGESTAAGLGARTHDEGFPGCLARELAGRRGCTVHWTVVGKDGATGRRIRHRLLPQLLERLGENVDAGVPHVDVAVLLAGVNDVLSRREPGAWGDDLAAILDGLSPHVGRLVVSGTPPISSFPALPRALGRYLGERAGALDAVSERVCRERPRTTWVPTRAVPVGGDFFAGDGFHPSAAGYRRWAEVVADAL